VLEQAIKLLWTYNNKRSNLALGGILRKMKLPMVAGNNSAQQWLEWISKRGELYPSKLNPPF